MIRVMLTTRKKKYTLASGKTKERRYYVLRWRDTGGQWRAESIGVAGGKGKNALTKAEAESERYQKQLRLNDGRDLVDRPEKMTVRQFIAHHERLVAGDVREGTLLQYRNCGAHLIRSLGDVLVENLDRSHAAAFKAYLQQYEHGGARVKHREGKEKAKRPLSNASIHKLLRTARAMFSRAVDERLVAVNPFAGIALPKLARAQHRIFDETEEQAIYDVLSETPDGVWWEAFIALGISTGLRRGESLNLLWSDVDFEQRQVAVTAKRPDTFEVDGARYPILAFEIKDHEGRTVPLSDHVLGLLRKMRIKSGGSRYVFLSLERLAAVQALAEHSRARRIDLMNNLNRRFAVIQRHARKLLADRAGKDLSEIDWRIGSIHDLRRTFGTRAARSGVPMHVLRELMGHESIQTTQRYYLQVSASDMDTVRQAVGRRQQA